MGKKYKPPTDQIFNRDRFVKKRKRTEHKEQKRELYQKIREERQKQQIPDVEALKAEEGIIDKIRISSKTIRKKKDIDWRREKLRAIKGQKSLFYEEQEILITRLNFQKIEEGGFETFVHTRTKKFRGLKKRTKYKVLVDKYRVKDAVKALKFKFDERRR
jgi:hypothetical protein